MNLDECCRATTANSIALAAAFIAAACTAFCPLGAWAQRAPDAGAVLQQIERGEAPPIAPSRPSPLQPSAPVALQSGGARVLVKQFHFEGNTRLSEAQLQKVVKAWLGKELDFGELQRVALAVAQAYREAGWVVRVDLPVQDVTEGSIELRIQEAMLGAVNVVSAPIRSVSASRAVATIEAQQQPGEPLSVASLDRGLLLINDLPGAAATATLGAGSAIGQTDVNVSLSQQSLLSGSAYVDNSGEHATGSVEEGAHLTLNSPSGIGDQIAGDGLHTDGSNYGRLAYSIPVGYDGWRVGANASTLYYRLTADEFKALDATGTARSYGVEASYPLIRSTTRNLSLQLAFDDRQFDNLAEATTVSNYTIYDASASLSASIADTWLGGGFDSSVFQMTHGHFDRGDEPVRPDGSDQDFWRFRYSFSRWQGLTTRLSLFVALNGQFTNRNLDSSERFYLGGPSGVRAYPVNEAGGAQGTLLAAELRQSVWQSLTVAEFYDQGWITQYHDDAMSLEGPLSGTAPNHYSLRGGGLTLSWAPVTRVHMYATWAHRIGNNPNPSPTGTDQDGTLLRNRFWLSASAGF